MTELNFDTLLNFFLVILKWLVDKFEAEKTYTEKEVNAIIGQYYDDYATVRREFIGYQLMKRDNSIYQQYISTFTSR